jgi:hypothetical protein
MASYPKPHMLSFLAGSDLSSKQFTFVKLTAEDTVDTNTTLGGVVIGVLMNAPFSGDIAEVALIGGGAKVKVGTGGLAIMGQIESDVDGTGIAAATTKWCAGMALKAGVAGDVIPAMLLGFTKV